MPGYRLAQGPLRHLVALDQRGADNAVVQIGAGQDGVAGDAGPQVDADMSLVPLMRYLDLELQAIDEALNIRRTYQVCVSRDLFGAVMVEIRWGRVGDRRAASRPARRRCSP